MSTVQVEDRVKKKLFRYAAMLQAKSGRNVSLSEAIDNLLETYSRQEETTVDKTKLLSLFGVLKGNEAVARSAVKQLRIEDEKAIERRLARASRKSGS